MSRRIVILAIAAVLAATATAADAATESIKVADNYYVRAGAPPTITVERNGIVVWNFVGRRAHTVHSADRRMPFQSRTMTSGRFARKVTMAGTFTIFCDIHGPGRMRMRLEVEP